MNHVILIGFMGCGKSSVGEATAGAMKVPLIDTDAAIEEETGRKIGDIFRESGEEAFRDMETDLLRRLLQTEGRRVVAVGGGLPMREENREYLKKLGTTVYLTAELETLVKRLEGDATRPLLQGGELRSRIEQLMNEREEVYRSVADVQVATDGKDITEIAGEVIRNVR